HYDNIIAGIVVHEDVIARNVDRELPFMATENLLMEGVSRGGDRQILHERIRIHSQAAADALKNGATKNDLFTRIGEDPAFDFSGDDLDRLNCTGDFIGIAPRQVEEFLRSRVDPLLQRESALISTAVGEVRI
ncbi:MAG: adenylosuccinate lyase, partial [Acidobacteriota bacterium]